jgi:hypothetical protein
MTVFPAAVAMILFVSRIEIIIPEALEGAEFEDRLPTCGNIPDHHRS